MTDPWAEARQLRQELAEARDRGRTTATQAYLVGIGVGLLVGYWLALAVAR